MNGCCGSLSKNMVPKNSGLYILNIQIKLSAIFRKRQLLLSLGIVLRFCPLDTFYVVDAMGRAGGTDALERTTESAGSARLVGPRGPSTGVRATCWS